MRAASVSALRRAFASVALLALAACAGLVPRLAPPEVRGASVAFVQVERRQVQLALELQVHNPNDVAVELAGLETSVRLEGVPVGQARLARPVTLAALGETRIDLDVRADVGAVLPLLAGGFATGRSAFDYEIAGVAVLADGRRFPFTRRGRTGAAAGTRPR
jgi:LEA14-like dessication related protein